MPWFLPIVNGLSANAYNLFFMTNAAESLADLIEPWRLHTNNLVESDRLGNKSPKNIDFWREQAKAIELLAEVDRSIDRLEDLGQPAKSINAIRAHLPTLYQAIFGYHPAWKSKAGRPAPLVDPQAVGALRQLGMTLRMSDLVPETREEDINQLRTLLGEAYEVVRSTDGLARDSQYFLFHLLSEARRYVDEVNTFGSSKAHAAILALCMEMQKQGTQLDARGNEEPASRLQHFANTLNQLAQAVFSAGAKRAGEIAASEATPKAIEAGAQALDIAKDVCN